MKLNLRGAIAGAAGGIQQTAQLMLTEDAQRLRDERMMQYKDRVRGEDQAAQMQIVGAQAQAKQAAVQDERNYQAGLAETKREQELADQATDHQNAMTLEGAKNVNRMELEKFKGKVNPDAANIEVNTGQNLDARTKKFSEVLGTADAELYDKTRTAASSAVQMEDSLHVLEEMQKQFETGKTQQALAILGQYANTDASAAMQAWEGTISPIVLSKAEGLSGVLSDKDMEFLKASVPQFGLDKKANQVMIGLMRKGMQRAIENEKSMQDHVNQYGNLNNWTAPNRQGTQVNASEAAHSNIGSADDPLGLFD